MSRADTNQWLSRNDGFFDTAASCELGLEKEAAVSDDDGDSAVEADEATAVAQRRMAKTSRAAPKTRMVTRQITICAHAQCLVLGVGR